MTDDRPTILAIDDTPANLLSLGAALATDFKLRLAPSGAIGLVLAGQSPPDLILLDVMMPEMDGYETCRRLKADPRLRMIPVIFVTALTEMDAEFTGLALGAADYLTKPLNAEIARQRIRNLLEREQLRKEVEAQRDHLEELVQVRTAQMRTLTTELVMAEERERREVAQDIHDDLCQILTVIKLKITSLKSPERHDDLTQQLQGMEELVDQANRSARSLSMQLSPPVLSQYGLIPALEWLADEMQRTHGLDIRIHCHGISPLREETVSITLYRIVRELLVNVSKYACVDSAEVSLLSEDGKLVITVANDGIGFIMDDLSPPSVKGGYRLFSVNERLRFLDGEMQIDSRPGNGTLVVMTVPLGAAGGVSQPV